MTTISMLAPVVTALGHQTVVIARNEAIFNCSLSRESSQEFREPQQFLVIFPEKLQIGETICWMNPSDR